MARVKLDVSELRLSARQQVALLLGAGSRFDAGKSLAYLEMATRLRVLLHHNPPRSSAVLAHLGLLDANIFTATGADLTPENLLPQHTLTFMTMLGPDSHRGRYWPRFNEFQETLPARLLSVRDQIHRLTHGMIVRDGGKGREFSDWWHQPIISDARAHTYSRWDLVRVTANQDGGAHVDPSLDERHHELTRHNAMGMFSADDPFESPVPSAIRQVTWEVHASLFEHQPDLLGLVRGDVAPLEAFPRPD